MREESLETADDRRMEEQLLLQNLPDVLTAAEVGSVLRIGRSAVYEGLQCGRIPSVRVGRRILVPKSALLRLLDAACEGAL